MNKSLKDVLIQFGFTKCGKRGNDVFCFLRNGTNGDQYAELINDTCPYVWVTGFGIPDASSYPGGTTYWDADILFSALSRAPTH